MRRILTDTILNRKYLGTPTGKQEQEITSNPFHLSSEDIKHLSIDQLLEKRDNLRELYLNHHRQRIPVDTDKYKQTLQKLGDRVKYLRMKQRNT